MTMAKSLILIAHEGMSDQLVKLVKTNREIFESYRLLSIKETGDILQKETGLEVSSLHSVAEGGEIHLCGLICTTGVIRAVFFLRDPLCSGESQPDIAPFYRACDLNKVPLATNIVAAAALMPWLGRKDKIEAEG
ncbi:MAG: methylglyoxal synthase [Rhodospirillales bacterium]|nr:methylglyoxal synthase [Rhodospirillales bacterium]